MDFVQLSILRAGGVYMDDKIAQDARYWHEDRRPETDSALQQSVARKATRPALLRDALGRLFLAFGEGLSRLGRRLQDRAERSAENAAINGCKAT